MPDVAENRREGPSWWPCQSGRRAGGTDHKQWDSVRWTVVRAKKRRQAGHQAKLRRDRGRRGGHTGSWG